MVGTQIIDPCSIGTEPAIIVAPPPKPTLFDFGWMLCEPMDALKTVWRDYGWDLDIWRQNLRPHLTTCPRCLLNRQAIEAYGKWMKEAQDGPETGIS